MSQIIVDDNPSADTKYSICVKDEPLSQIIVGDNPSEDTEYSIDIKEELLDVPSVTDIDSIKHGSTCATIKDEIDIKEEPFEIIDESDFNYEMRSSEPRNSNSSISKVCSLKYSFDYLFYQLICIYSFFTYLLFCL